MDIKKKTNEPDFKLDKQADTSAERIDPTGAIRKWMTTIKNTEVYQIFFVRAQQNSFSKGLTFLFLICTIFGHACLTFVLNPPPKLNELHVRQGFLEGYYYGGRRSHDKIVIRNEKGKKEKFEIIITNSYPVEQKLNSLRGELITIYYCDRIHLFFYPFKLAEAIAYKNKYIYEYTSVEYRTRQMVNNSAKKIFTLFVVVGISSLLIVYLRHRKKINN